STPGSARSITLACVLGAPPNAVAEPEKILLAVESCACVSRPITTSHVMLCPRSEARWNAPMPIRRALISVRHAQHPGFLEIVGHQLQANRPVLRAETARNAHARYASKGARHRVKIGEIHGDRVVAFFAEPERDAGGHRACNRIAFPEGALEI